jgi:hypothetical protein
MVSLPGTVEIPAIIEFKTTNYLEQIITSSTINFLINTRNKAVSHALIILQDQASSTDTSPTGATKLRLGTAQASEITRMQLNINGAQRYAVDLQSGRDLRVQNLMVYPQLLASNWATSESLGNSTQQVFLLNFSSDYDLPSNSGANTAAMQNYTIFQCTLGTGASFSTPVLLRCYVYFHSQLRTLASSEVYVDY